VAPRRQPVDSSTTQYGGVLSRMHVPVVYWTTGADPSWLVPYETKVNSDLHYSSNLSLSRLIFYINFNYLFY
jgi:hypothetical protein